MLRKHFYGLPLIYRWVEVLPQASDEHAELGFDMRLFGNEPGYSLDELAGDKPHAARPVFPVQAVTAFLDEFGVNAALHFRETQLKLARHFIVGKQFRVPLVLSVREGVAPDARRADYDLGGLVAVQGNLVYGGIEAVVVRAQRIEYVPDHAEAVAVVERVLWLDVGGHDHRYDDVAELLFAGFALAEVAHDTPYGLHHVNLRIARGEEKDGVESRHVNPLRQAADVGQHAALVFAEVVVGEPFELFVAQLRVHRAVDVAGCYSHHMAALPVVEAAEVFFADHWQDFGGVDRCAGGIPVADGGTECYGTAHENRVCVPCHAVVAAYYLGEAVDDTDQLGGVVKVQLLAV